MIKYIIFILMLFALPVFGNSVLVCEDGSLLKQISKIYQADSADISTLQKYLEQNGYLRAGIVVRGDTIRIIPGEIYYLSEIRWQDDTIRVSGQRVFTKTVFERLVDSLIASSRNEGFLYPSIRIEKIELSGVHVIISLTEQPGPRVRLDEIYYDGLVRTQAEILDKYIKRDTVSYISPKLIRDVEYQADDVPFVDFQPPAEIEPKVGYGSGDIRLRFKEQKAIYFEGGGGLLPNDNNTIVWQGSLKFTNLFGGGREIQVDSDHREENRQLLNVRYSQPLFLFGLGEVTAGVSTRDYRDLFYEFALDGQMETRLRNNIRFGIRGEYRNIQIDNDPSDYAVYGAGVSFAFTDLHNRLNPEKGWHTESLILFSYRRYSNDSLRHQSVNETRTELTISRYHPVWKSFVGLVQLKYAGLETKEELPPYAELYLVGGPENLRSYRNEQFPAIRYAVLTLEPRLRFTSGYLTVFYELGYINNRVANFDGTVRTEEDFHPGYGFGITLTDNDRSISILAGWNPDTAVDNPRLMIRLRTGL